MEHSRASHSQDQRSNMNAIDKVWLAMGGWPKKQSKSKPQTTSIVVQPPKKVKPITINGIRLEIKDPEKKWAVAAFKNPGFISIMTIEDHLMLEIFDEDGTKIIEFDGDEVIKS